MKMAVADYIADRITLEEFEQRTEAELVIREGFACAWPRVCDQIGHVYSDSPQCINCGAPLL